MKYISSLLMIIYTIYCLKENISKRKLIVFIVCLLLTMGLEYFQYYIFEAILVFLCIGLIQYYTKQSSYLFLGLIMITLTYLIYLNIPILTGVIFILVLSNQRSMKLSYEENMNEVINKNMNRQIEETNQVYMKMREWRHDYHNHLQSLKAYLSLNQIEEAKTYLNELETDLDHVDQLIETGNLALDAILNSKLNMINKENIEINYKAKVPEKLAVSDLDLSIIIGNLLDNALEACLKMDPDSKRFIRIYIGIFKEQLYITVTNTTNEVIKKLDEEYITTKRGNHGHGLKRINQAVEKYDGYINRKNEPGYFVTEILLPL